MVRGLLGEKKPKSCMKGPEDLGGQQIVHCPAICSGQGVGPETFNLKSSVILRYVSISVY